MYIYIYTQSPSPVNLQGPSYITRPSDRYVCLFGDRLVILANGQGKRLYIYIYMLLAMFYLSLVILYCQPCRESLKPWALSPLTDYLFGHTRRLDVGCGKRRRRCVGWMRGGSKWCSKSSKMLDIWPFWRRTGLIWTIKTTNKSNTHLFELDDEGRPGTFRREESPGPQKP